MADRAIDRVAVGLKVRHRRTITEETIRQFAAASGDFNPLHLDEEYAERTVFGHRIAHGILTLGLVSAALSKLPGVVVYASQTVKFTRPVKIGDTVEATAEVIEKSEDRNEARLRTYAENQEGELLLDGEARVRLLDLRE